MEVDANQFAMTLDADGKLSVVGEKMDQDGVDRMVRAVKAIEYQVAQPPPKEVEPAEDPDDSARGEAEEMAA